MKYWLMKAEPESRVVKGKDVKFSVDDFEAVSTTPWEGVRNAEARNLMKSMSTGDRVLFYHSNCKNPGIAAFAEVSKEAYPDYTAWDSSHPYYDAKTDKENPKWYMVDVTFQQRAAHFVSLALLKRIGAGPAQPSTDIEYIGADGVKAIKAMALLNRGRLSVQPVEEDAFNVIKTLAETGGWDEDTKGKSKQAKKAVEPVNDTTPGDKDANSDNGDVEKSETKGDAPRKSAGKKRKAVEQDAAEAAPLRRSIRSRK